MTAPGDGLAVGRLGFGAMQLPGPGVWGPPRDRHQALAVLRAALDAGIDHIDTSAAYGPAVANELIRAALHPYPPGLVVATKVGVIRDDARAFAPAASPAQLREQVEANLRQLGLERLELVYLRVGGDGLLAPDPTPLEESFGCLAELRERGLVGRLGLSGVSVAQLERARGLAPVAAVQNRFHVLDRSSTDVLAACERHGIPFVPYFPLAAGLLRPGLDTSRLPPGMGPSEQQLRVLDEVAARHGATRVQVALAWLLHHSAAILAIPGTSSLAHLHENVAAGRLALGGDDVAALDELATAPTSG